jgi:hypothetical protein
MVYGIPLCFSAINDLASRTAPGTIGEITCQASRRSLCSFIAAVRFSSADVFWRFPAARILSAAKIRFRRGTMAQQSSRSFPLWLE